MKRTNKNSTRLVSSALLLAVLLFVSVTVIAGPQDNKSQAANANLIAHEWGTFTSIGGTDGRAVDWLPLSASNDLPNFVEHFSTANFKGGLRGKIRMETPVIYFYSTKETQVSVNVAFQKGLITEWYPRAAAVKPTDTVQNVMFYFNGSTGTIAWNDVTVAPNDSADFLRENSSSHYYAARETGAAPLRINTKSGKEQEKFLFYRGVSSLSPPVSAKLLTNGNVQLENTTGEAIPAAILFERRGKAIGYRIIQTPQEEAVLEAPELNGDLDTFRVDLVDLLTKQGLYRDEARAMVETWRDSWFEEGSRLFYIVPRATVDKILPLAIHPTPTSIERVFVGRAEVVTPATERAVERAFATGDRTTLAKYNRFLFPILEIMIQSAANPEKRHQLEEKLTALYIHPELFASAPK